MNAVGASLVVTFRALAGPGRGFLERARALIVRAAAIEGVLVAWDAARVAFAFPVGRVIEALRLALEPGDDVVEEEERWAVGVAQGELTAVGAPAGLAWGPPLVAASALATTAAPGEILCAQSVRALASGELISSGTRLAREGALRFRGVRLDPITPFRDRAVAELARLRNAPFVGFDVGSIALAAHSLAVLRADSGAGGSRALVELARRAPRALIVSPAGAGYEPLGALRHAFERLVARGVPAVLRPFADTLGSLSRGEPVSLEAATRLLVAALGPPGGRERGESAPALLAIDDAKGIDLATLAVCVRAARSDEAAFAALVRIDASSALPAALATMPRSCEVELAPLGPEASEALARGCTGEQLDPVASKRWARISGGVPLGIVESIAWGTASGEIVWANDVGRPRSRSSGRGKVRPPAAWIGLRARDESARCRMVLGLVALLGGEARVDRVVEVLGAASMSIDVPAAIAEATRGRWLSTGRPDWLVLPSRTHREALVALLDEGPRLALHAAVARVIERGEGAFGCVEAAWHAAQVGDVARASALLLAAARATSDANLEASTTHLIAFARRIDPVCEEAALELLSEALSRMHSLAPPRPVGARSSSSPARALDLRAPAAPTFGEIEVSVADEGEAFADDPHQDEPTIAFVPAHLELGLRSPAPPAPAAPVPAKNDAPAEGGPSGGNALPLAAPRAPDLVGILGALASGPLPGAPAAPAEEPRSPAAGGTGSGSVTARLAALAKEAMLNSDREALERCVDGLVAAGERVAYTDRMRALVRLGRGDVGDALRLLRSARADVRSDEQVLRSQTSLAFALALTRAGREHEALLEALDALARAKASGSAVAVRACCALLAKLYASTSRETEALDLQAGAR